MAKVKMTVHKMMFDHITLSSVVEDDQVIESVTLIGHKLPMCKVTFAIPTWSN